jgi:hypothetical protein
MLVLEQGPVDYLLRCDNGHPLCASVEYSGQLWFKQDAEFDGIVVEANMRQEPLRTDVSVFCSDGYCNQRISNANVREMEREVRKRLKYA